VVVLGGYVVEHDTGEFDPSVRFESASFVARADPHFRIDSAAAKHFQ
jgi:hypothetical protein